VVIGGEESGWMEVISGVPQGSILGPILFPVFVNDLNSDGVNRVWEFADDVKMIGNVWTFEGVREFREDLTRMEKWAEVWQMGFNGEKCKVMGLGHRNECLDSRPCINRNTFKESEGRVTWG